MFISWYLKKYIMWKSRQQVLVFKLFLKSESNSFYGRIKQSKIWQPSSISKKYLLLSRGWILLLAGSSGVSRQSESLIQYFNFYMIELEICTFTIISINYCLQIALPKADAFNDHILKYLTGKTWKAS